MMRCIFFASLSNNFEFSKLPPPTLKDFNFHGFFGENCKLNLFSNYFGDHFGPHGTGRMSYADSAGSTR